MMVGASLLMFSLISLSIILKKGNDNTKNLVINHIEVPKTSKLKKPINILHLSDLHLEHLSISALDLKKQLINQPIDLIALTGDFLDRSKSIPKLIPYLKVFQEINPTYGTFAVFGNHDYVLSQHYFKKLKNTLISYGVHTLQNESVSLTIDHQNIYIIGIDDYSTLRSNIKESYENVGDGYKLVLTHDPNIVLEMKEYPYDYLLSGHFHGGQIHWPKPYHLVKMGQLVKMNMVKGLQQYNGKPFYISEGLGQTGVNIRLGSRPEITFHEIA